MASTRARERQALASSAPHALMARAGLSVARLALAVWPRARRLQVVAGPGNNGGDAMVAARWLHVRGLDVHVVLLGDPSLLPEDARWALAQAQAAGVPIGLSLPASLDGDGVLDGLVGLGCRPFRPGTDDSADVLADAVRRMNAGRAPVLSIDLPSGLDADRGTCTGPTVVAAHTLCLLTIKPGLFTAQGRDHAGEVWLDDLSASGDERPLQPRGDHAPDLQAMPAATSTVAPAQPARPRALHLIAAPRVGDRPVGSHASHKGRFGDVAVVGGAPGMVGAAVLAARSALAAGAGRVFLVALDPGPAALDPQRPELMLRPLSAISTPAWLAAATVVAGCGGGDAVGPILAPLLMHAARLVLDADALNAISADPGLQQSLAARRHRLRSTVLTPHPLEAARLLSCTTVEVQADRIQAARALAARYRCVVVLKGSGTVVAAPDGPVGINPTGNARLASAGTGDVLAGWLGGTWSRAIGDVAGADPWTQQPSSDEVPRADDSAIEAAERTVFLHGRAAELAPGQGPLLAADLIEAMRLGAA